jgi:predicted glycosyltransferase
LGYFFKIIFRTKQNNTYIYSHQNENPNTYNHGKSQDAKKTAKKSLKTAKEKRKTKKRKENLKETSFNFTNQYRNTNFTDFHQLILSIETC